MKEYFRKLLHNYSHDKYCYLSTLFAAVLLIFHYVQFVKSGYMIEPLIRIIFCVLYPAVIFFAGREAIPFCFLVFALAIEQFTDFSNYTAIFIISLFLVLHRKWTIPVLILYAIDVFIVCENHDKSNYHLIIHFINSAFVIIVINAVFYIAAKQIRKNAVKLDLDDSDREILKQLAAGAKHKEVEGYSENTVTKRLRKMRDRNFCETNAELLLRFISENQ